MLYSQNDITLNNKLKKQRLTWLIIVSVALLLIIIFSFVIRQKLLSVISTIVLGFFLTSYIGLIVLPIKKYEILLNEMFNGRKRENLGFIKNIGNEVLTREGVDCYQIIVKVGEDKSGDEDIILYLDAKKQLDNININDPVKFETFDRFIFSYEKLSELKIPTIK